MNSRKLGLAAGMGIGPGSNKTSITGRKLQIRGRLVILFLLNAGRQDDHELYESLSVQSSAGKQTLTKSNSDCFTLRNINAIPSENGFKAHD